MSRCWDELAAWLAHVDDVLDAHDAAVVEARALLEEGA